MLKNYTILSLLLVGFLAPLKAQTDSEINAITTAAPF